MKKLLSIVSILLLTISLNAQEVCGFDNLLDKVLSDSITSAEFESVKTAIRNQIVMNNGEAKDITQPNTYTIPVVFHVIGDGTAAALTDAQIIAQLQVLNDGFSNSLGSAYGVADDAQITFCLAQKMPDGTPFNGITRTSTLDAITVSNNHHTDALVANGQQTLTDVIYFNPSRYLNIWIVNSISLAPPPNYVNNVLGYSPFPLMSGLPNQFLDGVVMRSDVVGFTSHPIYNQGRVLIHEVGHYLGLFHTFQFGCSEVINGNLCNADGDECCDTPPAAVANQNDCILLGSPISCSGGSVMKENHMDYAYDNVNTCRNTFTEDQSDRMHATIQVFRSTLVSFQNLLVTGLQCLPGGLNPTFTTTDGNTQFCINNPYGFLSASGASTYSWNFPDGTPSTSSAQNPTGISWAVPGTYNVSLTVTDNSGTSLSSFLQVFVSNCTPVTGANANWYFGARCAISFTSGVPTPIVPSSMNTFEASAAVSNNAGNLIFYTNGQTIWNNSHNAIPGLMSGSTNAGLVSNSKGVVIVPRPGTNRFYIFPTSDSPTNAISNTGRGVIMYEFNTATNSLVSTTPTRPTINYATTEPIVAIPHCNGQDYWVVVKPVNNNQPGLQNAGPDPAFIPLPTPVNNLIASYLVSTTGIAGTPVLSNSGPFIPSVSGIGSLWAGHTVVSPDKKMIAFTDFASGNCYVYFFNSGNGNCQYITTLTTGIRGYGVSFSPNSKVLYVNIVGLFVDKKIRQYDISNLSICNPNPKFVDFDYKPALLSSPSLDQFYSMQLGPDNKIYVARNPQQAVAAINFPDVINSSSTSNECGYNFNAVPLLPGQTCEFDLPNDIIGFIGANTTDFSFCVTGCAQTCFTNLGCGTNFTWDFGDGNTITGVNGDIPAGTNGGTTSGNFEYPCHTYANPGSYTVTYSIDGGTPVSHVVNITVPDAPTITGPNPVCSTSTLPESYFAPPGYNYSWTATNASPTTGNLQTFNVSWTSFPATLTLVITDPATGCTNSNSITITQTSTLPIVNAGTDVNVCPPGSVQLNGAVSNGTIIGWSPSTDLSCVTCLNPSASPSTTTTYTLSAFNGCGTSTDQVTVDVTCGSIDCTLPTTHTLPNGAMSSLSPIPNGSVVDVQGLFTINSIVTYTNVKFRMAAGARIDIASGNSLTLNKCHLFSCTQLWKEITVNPNANLVIQNFTIIEDAEQAIHWINGGSVNISNSIFNRNGAGLHLEGAATAPNVLVRNTIFTCRDFPASVYTSLTTPTFFALKNNLYNNNLSLYPYGSLIAPAPANTRSLYGVISTQVAATIGVTSNPKNRNLFDYLDFGIQVSNANFTVVNNAFANLSGYDGSTVAMSGNIKGIGVYASTKGAFTITIGGTNVLSRNLFNNCYRGANLTNYRTINFTGNILTNTTTSLTFAPPSYNIGHYGLAIFQSGGGGISTSVNYVIRNNNIDNNETGIYINGVYSLIQNNFTQITNNQMDVTGTGTYCNRGVWIQNMVGSQAVNGDVFVSGNTIENCEINAMLFENVNDMLRVDGNLPSVVPTPTLQTKEVVRLNSCTNASVVNNTITTTNNTTIPSGTTTNFITGIFVNKCQSSLVSCNTILYVDVCVAFIQSNSMTQFSTNDMNYAQYGLVLANGGIIGQQGDATHPSGNKWGRNDANNITLNHTYIFATTTANTASPLYCKPNTGPTSCSSGSLFKTFPCSNSSLNPGEQYQLGSGLNNATGPSPGCTLKPGNPKANALALLQEATNGNGSNVDKFLHKSQAFHLVKTDQTGVLLADPTLSTFYQQEQIQNIGKLSTTNELVVANDYVTAKNTVNSLAPTNVAESNFKIAYDVWLDLLLDSNYVLNTSDSLQLVIVANMCIQEGGDATIMARTLLANFTQNAVNYVDCFELPFGDTANRISETSSFDEKKIESFGFSQEVKINLYPNPNNGSFRVTHNLSLENNVYIEVIDITGKIVHRELLTTGNQQEVKTQQLNTGLYFVNFISDSGELMYSTKMSILHE